MIEPTQNVWHILPIIVRLFQCHENVRWINLTQNYQLIFNFIVVTCKHSPHNFKIVTCIFERAVFNSITWTNKFTFNVVIISNVLLSILWTLFSMLTKNIMRTWIFNSDWPLHEWNRWTNLNYFVTFLVHSKENNIRMNCRTTNLHIFTIKCNWEQNKHFFVWCAMHFIALIFTCL